jgi:hypothetical protein
MPQGLTSADLATGAPINRQLTVSVRSQGNFTLNFLKPLMSALKSFDTLKVKEVVFLIFSDLFSRVKERSQREISDFKEKDLTSIHLKHPRREKVLVE